MKDQIVTAGVKAEMRYLVNGQNAENVYWAKASGTIDEALLDSLAALLIAWEDTEASAQRSADCDLVEIILTDMSSLAGVRKVYGVSPPQSGAVTGDAMPNNVTLAVKENIGQRGRGINGRKFWIGLAESQCAGDVVDGTVVTAIVGIMNNLRDSVAGLTGFEGLCIPHFVVNKVPQNPADTDVITGFSVANNVIDSMRDRLPFHKRHKRKATTPPTP